MPNDNYQKESYQIYQIDIPGPIFIRHVVATSLRRAMELSILDDEELVPGTMLMVSNVTSAWICHSPLASQSTWSLLRERREGLIEYDTQEGWDRLPSEQ
jgi:hypothetical protein